MYIKINTMQWILNESMIIYDDDKMEISLNLLAE